jgi:hypothetical protein
MYKPDPDSLAAGPSTSTIFASGIESSMDLNGAGGKAAGPAETKVSGQSQPAATATSGWKRRAMTGMARNFLILLLPVRPACPSTILDRVFSGLA